MLHYRQKSLLLATIAIFIAFLAIHAYLGSYSRFIADDYCSAAVANTKGVIGGTFHWYLNWSGRFSANFLDSLIGYIGPRITPYASSVVIVIWLGIITSVLYFSAFAFHNRTQFLGALLLAAMLLSTTLIVTPDIAQSLYWGQGMRSVAPPLILATAFIGLIQYYYKYLQKKSLVWFVIAGSLIFIAGGFSETYVALQTFILAIIILLLLPGVVLEVSSFGKNVFPFLAVALLCSICAIAVVIVAPGNKYRQAFFPPPPGLLKLIEITGGGMGQFVCKIMLSPVKISSLLGIVGFSVLLGAGIILDTKPDVISRQTMIRMLLWLPPLTFALLFVCFVPAAYGMSSVPPARTSLIPTYVLSCTLTLWGYVLGQFSQTNKSFLARGTRLFQLLVAWSVLSLFIINTLVLTYEALQRQPELNSYATTWDKLIN